MLQPAKITLASANHQLKPAWKNKNKQKKIKHKIRKKPRCSSSTWNTVGKSKSMQTYDKILQDHKPKMSSLVPGKPVQHEPTT